MIRWPARQNGFGIALNARVAILVALLSVCWMLGTGTALAQMAPIGVGLTTESETVTVGDVLTFRLSVTHPADYHVVFPDVPSQWGEFEVRKTTHLPTEVGDDGTLLSTVLIEAVLFQPGVHSTPALSVAVRRPDGSVVNRPARPIEIEVASVLASGANELKDIRPQAEVPFPTLPMTDASLRSTWPWMLGGATGLLILLVIYLLWRRSMSQTIFEPQLALSPLETALQELDRIDKQNLPGQGRYLEHYSLVAKALRGYLFGQFRIPAPELTTEQSISVLDRRPVSPNDVRDLGEVLAEADLVKFARLSPQLRDARAAIVTARRVVNGLTAAPSRFRPSGGYTSGRYTR